MRKKPLVIDGAEFVITPLLFEQHEAYVFAVKNPDAAKTHIDEQLKVLDGKPIDSMLAMSAREIIYVLCPGLNNAITDGNPRWNIERVYKELDGDLARQLIDAILSFTVPGWARLPSTARDQGEAPAASTTQPSEAAS